MGSTPFESPRIFAEFLQLTIFTSKQLILFFADFQNTKKVEEMRLNS